MNCFKPNPASTTAAAADDDDGLETRSEYKLRWHSIWIINFTLFLMTLGFSVVLSGIWPFLIKLDPQAGKEFLGYVVAANPIGQLLFSPLFGWWGNKVRSMRWPLFCSIAIFGVASAVYSSMELLPVAWVKYVMVASRFLVGVGSANSALCRAYISDATRLRERTDAVSMASLAQVLGYIVGPALQALVTPLGDRGVDIVPGILTFNMYTAAGWINSVLAFGNVCLFLPCIFKEQRIAAREMMVLQGKNTEEETWKGIRPDYFSAWSLIVASFVMVFNYTLLETIVTSLGMDQFAWTNAEALYYVGIILTVSAIVACLTFLGIGPLCRRFNEHSVLLWGGFLAMIIGRILYIPWGSEPAPLQTTALGHNESGGASSAELIGCPAATQPWCLTTPALTMEQFLAGILMTSIGWPIGLALIQAQFSKVLGPRPQGVWMAVISGSNCAARMLGAVFVGWVYTGYGMYVTFGSTAGMVVLTMLWMWWFREHFERVVAEQSGGGGGATGDNDAVPMDEDPLRRMRTTTMTTTSIRDA